ncbi:DUF6286 domain-containing protein [Actinocorallia populi]|uniref:DUF6286 domain-containing protein n=1 Tax=Actinocorallia populi TaxID=2079200 RepID=UPI000D095B78|nr:DUF6286 domain-containing protein [Actinocorallia populi]
MGETLVTELFGDSARRREARRRTAREFRKERTAAESAVAFAMAACGGLGAGEVLARRYGHHLVPPAWTERLNAELRALLWGDPAVELAGYLLWIAGMALLLLAVLPGYARTELLRGDDPAVSAALSREGLRRSLADAALGTPGVVRARVRVGRRITVRAKARRGTPPEALVPLRRAVLARLEEIGPQRRRAVAVRLGRGG